MIQALFDFALKPDFAGLIITAALGQIGLRNVALVVVMSVFVVALSTQELRTGAP
jgi:hypothetical protein